jgi:hypothetical protein
MRNFVSTFGAKFNKKTQEHHCRLDIEKFLYKHRYETPLFLYSAIYHKGKFKYPYR